MPTTSTAEPPGVSRGAFPLRLASAALAVTAALVIAVPIGFGGAPRSSGAADAAVRTTPTDPYRSREWALAALHVAKAWTYTKGDDVTVAVLDTGVDVHQPDLVGRVVTGPDYTGHVREPGDRYWGRHGTAVASIIAGHGHGVDHAAGVMGVAPHARILSIRVTWENGDPARDDPRADDGRDEIARGIRYAVDHGADVINMSLGGGTRFYHGNAVEKRAITYALGQGVVLVASSGNDGEGANRRNYPAAYPGVIAVGAVDQDLQPADFTNRHAYVSLAAPGIDIVSADAGRGYVLGTGTSPSAAFVAGIAALVRSRYPRLSPRQVRRALEEGTTHRPAGGDSVAIGAGVADAYGALRAAAHIGGAPGGTDPSKAAAEPESTPVGAAGESHSSETLLVVVLTGGGVLVLAGLVVGRRQRRRPEEENREPPPEDLSSEERPREPVPSAEPYPALRTPPWHGTDTTPQWAPGDATKASPAGEAPPGLVDGDPSSAWDPLGRTGPLPEVGTPLADESWEWVHRGHDHSSGEYGG